MPRTGGDADRVSTPLVMGEQVETVKYGDVWTEEASRKFFAAYIDYEERLRLANATGFVRHEKVSMGQLIPGYILRCFESMYKSGGGDLKEDELRMAVEKHAGYGDTSGECDPTRALADLRKVLRMRQGGETSVKDRAMTVTSAMEKFFAENHAVHALYRDEDRCWRPGPAESVSRAMVTGLWPSSFRTYVEGKLTYVEGWRKDPAVVMREIFEAADKWRFIEDHGPRARAGDGDTRHGQPQQKSKQQSGRGQQFGRGPVTCFTCGEVGHKSWDCPRRATTGAGAVSSANRGADPVEAAVVVMAAGEAAEAINHPRAEVLLLLSHRHLRLRMPPDRLARLCLGELCMLEEVQPRWVLLERTPCRRSKGLVLLLRWLRRRRLCILRLGLDGTSIQDLSSLRLERSLGVR